MGFLQQLRGSDQRSPQRQAFDRFRLGASIFFLGLVGVYGAGQGMQPSLQQELALLLALLVTASGFVIGLTGYLKLLVARLRDFFR